MTNERTIKIPEKELSEMEIANLSDTEFKTLVIKMFRISLSMANA